MSTSAQSPVDLVHLARYTGGERARDTEILQLFVRQSAELIAGLPAILAAGDREQWHHITHSLKGAARGVGAFELARIAAHGESVDPVEQRAQADSIAENLEACLNSVIAFLGRFLQTPADNA